VKFDDGSRETIPIPWSDPTADVRIVGEKSKRVEEKDQDTATSERDKKKDKDTDTCLSARTRSGMRNGVP